VPVPLVIGVFVLGERTRLFNNNPTKYLCTGLLSDVYYASRCDQIGTPVTIKDPEAVKKSMISGHLFY
jgi:hypothetical protein